MARKFPVRDDFEPLFYDELGRLIVAAGRIEYTLKLCIKTLSGMGFTAGMLEAERKRRIPDLCQTAQKLAKKQLPDAQNGPFCDLVGQIRKLTDERNDIIHAAWTTDDDRVPFRIRPDLTRPNNSKTVSWSKTQRVPLNEMRNLRRSLENAYTQLQCLRKDWNLKLEEV